MAYSGLDISGRVCLVSGGTSGIGRAISLGLASAGAMVIAASSSEQRVSAIRGELGGAHDALQFDVSDPAGVQAAVDHVRRKYGRIDALVNAASIVRRQPTLDVSLEEWERIIRVNLTGCFIICQAVGRAMMDQAPDARGSRGSIVNLTSLSAYVAFEGVCAYGASKAGVAGLTRSLANDWAELGIRVNAISPGIFPSERNRAMIEGTPRGEWLRRHTPMERFGSADEIVGAAVYLISSSASFVNGQVVTVDGGFLARGV